MTRDTYCDETRDTYCDELCVNIHVAPRDTDHRVYRDINPDAAALGKIGVVYTAHWADCGYSQ